jgi:hypothetical protein
MITTIFRKSTIVIFWYFFGMEPQIILRYGCCIHKCAFFSICEIKQHVDSISLFQHLYIILSCGLVFSFVCKHFIWCSSKVCQVWKGSMAKLNLGTVSSIPTTMDIKASLQSLLKMICHNEAVKKHLYSSPYHIPDICCWKLSHGTSTSISITLSLKKFPSSLCCELPLNSYTEYQWLGLSVAHTRQNIITHINY